MQQRVRFGQLRLFWASKGVLSRVSLVTVLPDNEAQFWVDASQTSLDAVWDNTEDDVYAQLLLA